MALFMDGPVSSIEDLTEQDTQLGSVANAEGIDVTQKLWVAQKELQLEIETLLSASRMAEPAFWIAPQATIGNVAVTPALKLWHTFRSLELVYRDAYADQLNDRYAAKRDQFQERANWAYERLLVLGIGIVWSPVPRAAEPAVASAAGSLANGIYYLAATWTNGKGEEGAPSGTVPVTIAGSAFQVQSAVAPAGMAGWNVYAGTDPGALWRQNGSPIAVSQMWLQANPLTTGGSGPGRGQAPDTLMAAPRRILRG